MDAIDPIDVNTTSVDQTRKPNPWWYPDTENKSSFPSVA